MCSLIILVVGSACTSSGSTANGPITVAAAADLQYAFTEIGTLFRSETGIRVDFSFGSTGLLAQQIERGAPIDVFAAANRSFVDELAAAGLTLDDSRQIYAMGRIVVWTRSDTELELESLDDLASPAVRNIAIANPQHAPYGIAAREALVESGIWEQIGSRLVLGENIRQTLQFVETGNVDAAIVALSLAVAVPDGRWFVIPAELHEPIVQEMAVIAGTSHEAGARSFMEFVASRQGRDVMERHGFLLPDEAGQP